MTARVSVIDLSPPGHQPRSLIVLLRARKDGRSAQYYARRLVPPPFRKTRRNPYVTKALGAVSLERAKELAWQWWNRTEQKIDGGQSLREESFSRIAESYLGTLESKSKTSDDRGRPIVNPKKYRRHEQCIRLHLAPFFGPMAVGSIRQDDIERWLEWRVLPRSLSNESDARKVSAKSERAHLPARSTIQKDGVAFAAVVRHARLHFKIDTRFIPDIALPPRTEDTRRPRFYPDEWQRIKQALYERMNSRTGKSGPLSVNSWWFRIMLFHFVITLHGTGLRVAEATRLKVKHLKRVPENAARSEAYRKQLELAVGKGDKLLSNPDRGKMIDDAVSQLYDYRVLVEADNQLKHFRHQRAVVPLMEMMPYFDQLLTILALNLPEETIGENERRPDQLPPDVWLFCHLDGRRIKSFDNGFDEVLKGLGLLYHNGKKRSLTSIRHTYASERIEIGKADLKAIADNMGTTLEMLHRHYSQEIRELRAADLQVAEI